MIAKNTKQTTVMNIANTPQKPAVGERARQLADVEANNGDDAAEIAASDAFKEFPPAS